MSLRIAIAGLAVGALLAVGCSLQGERGTSAPPTPAPVNLAETAVVVEKLRAGTAFLERTSFRCDVDIYAVEGEITTQSHFDNVNKRAESTVSQGGKALVRIVMVDDDLYVNAPNLPGVGSGWKVLDRARVPANFAMSFAVGKNDPGGSARLIDAIVTAEMSGANIAGTLDAQKVGTGNGISFRAVGGTLPEASHRQPFIAALDNQGRLISFVVPAANGLPAASVRYSEFGADVRVSRPSDAAPAPDALYAQLGLPG